MEKLVTAMLIYLVSFQGSFCKRLEEPTCSKYDFEEKVLEKVVRFEHKMELMTGEISATVKGEIENMKTVMEARGTEQTKALNNKLSECVEDVLTRVRNELAEMKKVVNDTLQTEINTFKQSVQDLAAKVQQPSYGFLAYDLSATRPSRGDTLVFTKTHLNENGCYSTSNGQYMAPVDGVYEFHATLTGANSKKDVYVEFRMGETGIGKFRLGDFYYSNDSASGSVIVRLTKGTMVYIRVTAVASGFTFREDSYIMNTFTGHLISH